MEKPEYLRWLIKEDAILNENIKKVACYKIDYNPDDEVLNNWAKHIRDHYISEEELNNDSIELKIAKSDYLKKFIIPNCFEPLGSTAQSNTLSEIIFSDLLQFIYNFQVPRYRQYCMSGKTVSEHGTDIIAYKIIKSNNEPDLNDVLVACEVKAVLSKADVSVVSSSLIDINKDMNHRCAISLNYARRKLNLLGKTKEADDILRFQKQTNDGFECKNIFIAASMTSIDELDDLKTDEFGTSVKVINIDNDDLISLVSGKSVFFIHGKKLLSLAHDLYERCTRDDI